VSLNRFSAGRSALIAHDPTRSLFAHSSRARARFRIFSPSRRFQLKTVKPAAARVYAERPDDSFRFFSARTRAHLVSVRLARRTTRLYDCGRHRHLSPVTKTDTGARKKKTGTNYYCGFEFRFFRFCARRAYRNNKPPARRLGGRLLFFRIRSRYCSS